jgi:hypothetical protein
VLLFTPCLFAHTHHVFFYATTRYYAHKTHTQTNACTDDEPGVVGVISTAVEETAALSNVQLEHCARKKSVEMRLFLALTVALLISVAVLLP